jgi:hypothetical protein
MCDRYNASDAIVISKKTKKEVINPPKLFSLSKLQSLLGKKYKMSMADSLAIVQKLYEEGYLTYPRTNSEYLATNEKDKIKKIIANIKGIGYPVVFKDKKTIFDDSKIESHSALTPTYKIPKKEHLTEREMQVYQTVFRRFVAVFCDEDCLAQKTEIIIDVGGYEQFTLKGITIITKGFLRFDDSDKKDKNGNPYTLASTQIDEKYKYANGVEVHNWYEGYRGLQTMRAAIRDSLNVYSVKTLTDLGPELGYEYAEKLGINTLVDGQEVNGQIFSDVNQTLALGGITFGVRNIELNAAFSTIANGGKYVVPRLYTKVTRVVEGRDQTGDNAEMQTERVILDNTDPEKERVLKKTTCYLLTEAMKDVLTKGTGLEANFTSTSIAGKTGTTEDSNDVWFAGYSPAYTTTVWAGYDNNTKLTKEEESLAMIIWRQIMSNIDANKTHEDFSKPDDITTAYVCPDSGLLAVSGFCDKAYNESFVKGTEPTTYCPTGLKKKETKEKEEEEKKKRKKKEAEEAAKKAAEEAAKKAEESKSKTGLDKLPDDDDD